MPALASFYFPRFDPVIFRIGPLALRWYGFAYLLGFILAYLLLVRMARRGWLRFSPQLVGDFITWAAFGVFIGGRAGWWIFYHRAEGPEAWYAPFDITRGGMSFHGGFIGVLLAAYLWARRHHVSKANLMDCAALVTPIGLLFGRIANFINHELYGRPTDVPWAVIFPLRDSQYPNFVYEAFARHPSQLYEALLEGPVLLGLLWLLFFKRRPRDGGVALAFVILYSLIRFCVEFTRQPDPQLGYVAFGWLTMGQILSVGVALAGMVVWIVFVRRQPSGHPAETKRRK